MYFLVALGCTIIAGVLWFFFRDRKGLHLDILTIIFGAATLMWLGDCIFTAAEGEPFLTLSVDPNDLEALEGFKQDGWVAVWTVLGGLFLWLILCFIFNNRQKAVTAQ